MRQNQGMRKYAVNMMCGLCLVSAVQAWAQEEAAPPADNQNNPNSTSNTSTWKKTLQALQSYSQLGDRLQANQEDNARAVLHYHVLSENLKMGVSQDVFQQIRGFRRYSDYNLTPKLSMSLDMIKARPFTEKDTRILQSMTHFTTLQDSQGLGGKGVGVEFTYHLD